MDCSKAERSNYRSSLSNGNFTQFTPSIPKGTRFSKTLLVENFKEDNIIRIPLFGNISFSCIELRLAAS